MGVPALFRWLSKKYPKIVTPVVEESPRIINGVQFPADYSNPNPNGELDNLYLDMNGIVHPCYHPEDKPPPESESEMMLEIFKYTDRVVSMARPRKVLMIAVDGVAPRAKMNQQRSRRFRSAQEAQIKKEVNDRMVDDMAARGKIIDDSIKERRTWDTNSITPGTPFMDILADSLRYWATYKLNTDPGWANLNIIISDASVPGEGEHKIMEFIRSQRSNPRYNPNTSHAIYGLDADLIMLGLATHEPHFRVLREDVFAQEGQRKFCDLCRRPGHRPHECPGNTLVSNTANIPNTRDDNKKPFIWLHVSILREYLEAELKVPHLSFKFDLERALDDWVFMCFFVGNDFLPHLPTLDVRDEGIDILIQIWKSKLSEMGGFMTEDGKVNLPRTEILLRTLGTKEDDILRRKRQQDMRIEDREKRREAEREQRRVAASGGNRVDNGYYNQIDNMPVSVNPTTQTPSTANMATTKPAAKRYKKAKEPTAPIDNIPLYTTSGQAVGSNKMTNSELVANRNKITMANLANKSAAAVLRSKLAASKQSQSKPSTTSGLNKPDTKKVRNSEIIHNSEEHQEDSKGSSIPRKRKMVDKQLGDSTSSDKKGEEAGSIEEDAEVADKESKPSLPSKEESNDMELDTKDATVKSEESTQVRVHKKSRKEDNKTQEGQKEDAVKKECEPRSEESSKPEVKEENKEQDSSKKVVDMKKEEGQATDDNHQEKKEDVVKKEPKQTSTEPSKPEVGKENKEQDSSKKEHDVKKEEEEEEEVQTTEGDHQEKNDKDSSEKSSAATLGGPEKEEAKGPALKADNGIKKEPSIKSEDVDTVNEKSKEQSKENLGPSRRTSLGIPDILNPADSTDETHDKMDIDQHKSENHIERDQKPSTIFQETTDVKSVVDTADAPTNDPSEKPSVKMEVTKNEVGNSDTTLKSKEPSSSSSPANPSAQIVETTVPDNERMGEKGSKIAPISGDADEAKAATQEVTLKAGLENSEKEPHAAAVPDNSDTSKVDEDKMSLDNINKEEQTVVTDSKEPPSNTGPSGATQGDPEVNSGIEEEAGVEDEEEDEKKAEEEFEEMDEEEEEEIEQEIYDLNSIRLWEPGYRERYYQQKFHVSKDNVDEIRRKVVSSYIEGICWVLLYYYQGCPSWTWFYPYHYAPFAADCVDLSDINVEFDRGKPFRPYEQLMGVLPAASSDNLPKQFKPLMSDPKSEIIDFYPMDFKIDMNGKKMSWQGIALLPFIDEKRLLDAISKVYPTLTDEERRRNAFGSEVVLISDNHPDAKKLLEHFYSEKAENQVEDAIPLKKRSVGLLGYVTSDKSYGPDKATPFPPGGDAMPTIQKNHALSLVYRMPETKFANKSMLLNGCDLPAKVLNEVDLENVKDGGRGGQRVNQRNGHYQSNNWSSGYNNGAPAPVNTYRKGNAAHFGYNQYQNQGYHSGAGIYNNNASYPVAHGQPSWAGAPNASAAHPPVQSFGQWGSVAGGGNAPPPFQPWGGAPGLGNMPNTQPPPPSMAPFPPNWRPQNGAGDAYPPPVNGPAPSQYPFNSQNNQGGQFPGWHNK